MFEATSRAFPDTACPFYSCVHHRSESRSLTRLDRRFLKSASTKAPRFSEGLRAR